MTLPRGRAVAALLLLSIQSGCLRLATLPLREQREVQAGAALARLASLDPGRIARFIDRRLEAELGLSAAQTPRVEALDLRFARQLHDTAASEQGVRAKLQALRSQEGAKEAELRSILAPEQFQRYGEIKAALRSELRAWAEGEKP